jgi:rubrerythrin
MVMAKVDDLLIEAMNSEIEAKKFYEDASAKAQSQAGKQLFSELAEFEQNHYIRVKKIYELIQRKSVEEEFEEKQEIPTINAEVEGEFEPNKDEIVTVLTLAIDAEKKAQERYENIASLLDDDYKNIFTTLAQEERNHQKILEDEFYQLSNKGTIIWE